MRGSSMPYSSVTSLGRQICGAIATRCGQWLKRYLSEQRMLQIGGGVLLVFGVIALLQVLGLLNR